MSKQDLGQLGISRGAMLTKRLIVLSSASIWSNALKGAKKMMAFISSKYGTHAAKRNYGDSVGSILSVMVASAVIQRTSL
jgi:hypothetical protein